jgi:carboxymethylenebutenolidase
MIILGFLVINHEKTWGIKMNDFINDTKALIQESAFNRRDFMKTSALGGLGYAIASAPVMAQVIKTDTNGLKCSDETVVYGDSKLPVYVARPENAKGPLPIMIVVSEIFGLHEYIADVARRFAKLGYLAVAPEFFYRAGNPQKLPTVAQIQSEIVSKTPDQQVLTDIKETLNWAIQNGGNSARVGINGFCWGGRIVWLTCESMPGIKAGVAWYGRLTGEKSANFPNHPIDLAAQLKAPVLGLYGAKDAGISVATVASMQNTLQQLKTNRAAQQSQFVLYATAGHAFHADYRPSYLPDVAADGWSKAVSWFKEKGV